MGRSRASKEQMIINGTVPPKKYSNGVLKTNNECKKDIEVNRKQVNSTIRKSSEKLR
jgi:hypothetical protein